MKKKILLTTLAISTLLAFSACSSDDNKDTDVATKTSEATEAPADKNTDNNDAEVTEAPADNTDADETAAPDTTDTTEDPADVVESKEPGADEYHNVTDGDGNDITDQPTLAPPSLSDYPEGAYFDDNGNICIKEADGSERVLWDVYDGDMMNINVTPEDPTDDSSVPIAYTKEDKKIAIVDASGKVSEYLDSTDQDYIDVYGVSYTITKCLCYSPDDFDEKAKIFDSLKAADRCSMTEFSAPTHNDRYNQSFIEEIYFNADKTNCFLKIYVSGESDESGEMKPYAVYAFQRFKKENGKWLYTNELDSSLEDIRTKLTKQ